MKGHWQIDKLRKNEHAGKNKKEARMAVQQ